MEKEIEILEKCWLFQGLNSDELSHFLQESHSYCKRLGKGEILFYEGEIVKNIGIILSGSMAIVKFCENGNEHLFQKLNIGYIIGAEISCTKTKISPYSLQALEDTKLLMFSYHYLEKQSNIGEKLRLQIQNRLLQFIASENIRKYYKINILSTNSLRERILLYLQIQKRKKGSNCFEIPFDRSQLANYLCVNRSALSNELSNMQKDGLIQYRKNQFTLIE